MKLIGNRVGMIGDLHMGKHKEDRWIDIYSDLKKWIYESFYGKVSDLIFLGDVFDGHKEKTNEKAITFKMMAYISEFFDELAKDFNIIVYAGNHCCYYKDRCDVSGLTLFKGKENIQVIEETTPFSVGDKTYKIVPWACPITQHGDEPDEHVDAIFGHFDIKTFKLNNFKTSDHGFSTTELFKLCDTVYTGHYHMRQDRKYQKDTKRIFYAGSPLQLSWSETGKESYIYIVDLTKNEIVEEFVNDVSPKFVKVKASKLIKQPKNTNGDILEILWDVENNEENTSKINNILDTNGNFNCKNNFQLAQQTVVGELTNVNSAVDPTDILDLYVDAIEDVSDDCRTSISEKGLHYLNLTTAT